MRRLVVMVLLGCGATARAQCLSAIDCFERPRDPLAQAIRFAGSQPAIAGIAAGVLVAGGLATALRLGSLPADLVQPVPAGRHPRIALIPRPEEALPRPQMPSAPQLRIDEKTTAIVLAVSAAAIAAALIASALGKHK